LFSQVHLMISFCRKRPACRAGPGLQRYGSAMGSASPTPVNKLSTIFWRRAGQLIGCRQSVRLTVFGAPLLRGGALVRPDAP
jgi:hypothetical protein